MSRGRPRRPDLRCRRPELHHRAVDGGLVVTGKWGFASGCLHSQWAMLGVPVVDETGEQIDQGLALIPMSDLSHRRHLVRRRHARHRQQHACRRRGVRTRPPHPVRDRRHRRAVRHRAHRRGSCTAPPSCRCCPWCWSDPSSGLAQGALELVLGSLAKGSGISYTFYDKSTSAPPASCRSLKRPADRHRRVCTCSARPTTSTAPRSSAELHGLPLPRPGPHGRRHRRQPRREAWTCC